MDLLSSGAYWPLQDGLPASFPPLEGDATCDVLIVGAGIAGAMTARLMAEEKLDVIVVDRREVAHGSTAGNTGLLLYELDVPLHRLARRIGETGARRAYRRCRDAVRAMAAMARAAALPCGFTPRESLYLCATTAHLAGLKREYAARRAAGLEVAWWDRARLRAEGTLPHAAAIHTSVAAEVDAYRMTYGLLLASARLGARVHDRTAVTRWTARRSGIDVRTSRGGRVRARHVVVAAGYEAGRFLPRPVGRLWSTFALATEPLERFDGWPGGGALLWDTADPYLYLRTTPERRAIIGGLDEPFRDHATRDAELPRKVAGLRRRFRRFFPRLPCEVATAWAGTFGISDDGLPFVGPHPAVPHVSFALGFGGNGTVFSLIAAEIIRATLRGECDPDAELFGFEGRT